ncbi:MAG: PIN domain-containing protein [Thermoanaerobaculia bacterium]
MDVDEELTLLDDVSRGAYELASFDSWDVDRAREIVEQYRDLAVGLADASLVVLAERLAIPEILTLDERRFRVLRAAGGRSFTLLPADR